jgi:hypothetical protein
MWQNCGAGIAYPSTAPEFTPGFKWGSCYSIFSFMCMFCRPLFVLFLLTIVLSVLLQYTDSNYPFGIFKLWSLCCLFFNIQILITPLVSSNFGHCVVCSSSIYRFWLSLWYLQTLAIVLSVLQYTDSDYPFGIFKLFLQKTNKQIHFRDLSRTDPQYIWPKISVWVHTRRCYR